MELRDQLIRDEGLKLKPYKDTEGFLTIGVGRNLEGKGITINEAMYLLDNDIKEKTAQVSTAFSWANTLDAVRFSVLVNMAFMGIGKLKGFKQMLAAMQAGRWNDAAAHLMDSKYATQVGDRAKRLADQLTTGEWQ